MADLRHEERVEQEEVELHAVVGEVVVLDLVGAEVKHKAERLALGCASQPSAARSMACHASARAKDYLQISFTNVCHKLSHLCE